MKAGKDGKASHAWLSTTPVVGRLCTVKSDQLRTAKSAKVSYYTVCRSNNHSRSSGNTQLSDIAR